MAVISYRFKLCLLLSIVLVSCNRGSLKQVAASELASFGRCWINAKGLLSAYLILVKGRSGYVPYLISSKCLAKLDGSDEITAFVLGVGSIYVSDTSKVLQATMRLDAPIIDSQISDLPSPRQQEEVYYLVANAQLTQRTDRVEVDIRLVEKIRNMSLRYIDLAKNVRRPSS